LLLARLNEADRIDWSRAAIDSSHVRAFGGAPRRIRYERRDDIHEAFLAIGCSLICLKLLQAEQSLT